MSLPRPVGPSRFQGSGLDVPARRLAAAFVLAALMTLAVPALLPAPSAALGQETGDGVEPELLSDLELRTIGPAVMSGRIVDLAVVETDPRVFYAASATGGVWKTTNNGTTFDPVFRDQDTHSVGDIAVHQRDTSLVWVGTGERANRQSNSWGDGVYKSTDGGETWTHMGLEDSHHVGRIALHPGDPDVVFVAAMGHLWGPNEERGLYRSTDGGQTWERVAHVDENTGFVDVTIDPERPEIVYAASYQRRRRPYGFHGGGPGSGLWRSTDGGETFERIGPPDPDAGGYVCEEGKERTVHGQNGLPQSDYGRVGLSIHRQDPRIVYASVEQGCRFNASTQYGEYLAGIYRSEDRGRTWEQMTTWNPRPMYASQPLVDPTDDLRVYMMNRYSYWDGVSDTIVTPRQSLHGDDRILWVNPEDPRHVIKGDDGGVGISYDRGETWLYVRSLPVSQFYRISVDDRDPYWIYGGLQDNGSWAGPSATYRQSGVLNRDWIKTGGGDGFVNRVDPADSTMLYNESQYLGLGRFDLRTHQEQDLRPGDPTGSISPRRNWATWGSDREPGPLENAMEPANWEGPFVFSPHDPDVLYAGTRHLWRSSDGGQSWENLGDLTAGADRSRMRIMGQEPGERTHSLDDGIPYWPTITAIRESPVREGLVYVGTDDGRLQVSRDGGESFQDVSGRLPGLPEMARINRIEPSSHREGTVYVAVNNYRNDDYANYLYRSDDAARNWERIDADLPPERVARAVEEDPRNPDLLWLGTELGAFFSPNRGESWTEIRANLPRVAVNDLVVHPRENDLVLGTHGRGIWILDDVSAVQELTPDVLSSEAHVFSMRGARQIRRESVTGHKGDMVFRGENPPAGAIVDYWLRRHRSADDVQLIVTGPDGGLVRELEPDTARGVNRVVWDLRHEPLASAAPDDAPEWRQQADDGPLVVPATYTVRLSVGDTTLEQTVEVEEDPRLDVSTETRRAWTATLLEIADLHDRVAADVRRLNELVAGAEDDDRFRGSGDEESRERWASLPDRQSRDVAWQAAELLNRIEGLYGDVEEWTGEMTADQRSRLEFYREQADRLEPEIDEVVQRVGS